MFITPAGKYNKLLRSLGNYLVIHFDTPSMTERNPAASLVSGVCRIRI